MGWGKKALYLSGPSQAQFPDLLKAATQLKRHKAGRSMNRRGLELGDLQSSKSCCLVEGVPREKGDVLVVNCVEFAQLLHVALRRLDVPWHSFKPCNESHRRRMLC